jgi:uncharacterized lipoprotein YddW (UPF0748 family)
MIDQHGTLLRPSRSFYAFLSPGIPAVRKHLAAVCRELAGNYPAIDSIHLDYIRYPDFNEVGRARDFSYDKPSVDAFRKQTGKYERPDSQEWQAFKCEQIAESLRAMRAAVRAASPTMQLSATCKAEIHIATGETGQDVRIWLAENLVDTLIPMAYKRNTTQIREILDSFELFLDGQWQDRFVIGLNADFNEPGEIKNQMELLFDRNYAGEALFAYTSLFPNHQPNQKAKMIESLWRERQLKDLLLQSQ